MTLTYVGIATLFAASLVTITVDPPVTQGTRQAPQVLVIGHRGASGYRPEHTLASYELAIDLGADYIEPDLVSTRDHVLVARHENEIGGTTDVADHPEFADRKTTKVVDGVTLTGWFTEDFTLAELKTLYARERIPQVRQENTLYNDRYRIPTLQEVIDLAKSRSTKSRVVGLYPETKHPTYFDSIGLSLEEPLVEVLQRNGLNRSTAPVFVQSFEVGNLRELSGVLKVPLVQLFSSPSLKPYDFVASGDPRTYADLATPAGLAQIASYADGIGPPKDSIIPRDAAGNLTTPTSLVNDAHAAGLLVHPYTFRNENAFLPANLRSSGDPADPAYPTLYGKAIDEDLTFFATGIDGLFTDNTDTAIVARRQFEER